MSDIESALFTQRRQTCYPDLQSGSLCGRGCPGRGGGASWSERAGERGTHTLRLSTTASDHKSVRSWAPSGSGSQSAHPYTHSHCPQGPFCPKCFSCERPEEGHEEARCSSLSARLKMKIFQLKFGSVQLSANFQPCLWRGSAVHWLKVGSIVRLPGLLPLLHLTDCVTLDKLFNLFMSKFTHL